MNDHSLAGMSSLRSYRIQPRQFTGMKRIPAQARGMARVTEILDACETLLGDKRYDEINIDDILKASNVARGTLYHFFENRRAVFLSLMHRALLEMDEQTNARPGEEKLAFVDYVFKVERRLQKVWKKHNHMVEFYESNKFSPDFNEPQQEKSLLGVDVMAQQLRSRHPQISPARAQRIGKTLLSAMYAGLDTIAVMPAGERAGFAREWRQMTKAYIDSLELSKEL